LKHDENFLANDNTGGIAMSYSLTLCFVSFVGVLPWRGSSETLTWSEKSVQVNVPTVQVMLGTSQELILG
jgi:hypothetical protein